MLTCFGRHHQAMQAAQYKKNDWCHHWNASWIEASLLNTCNACHWKKFFQDVQEWMAGTSVFSFISQPTVGQIRYGVIACVGVSWQSRWNSIKSIARWHNAKNLSTFSRRKGNQGVNGFLEVQWVHSSILIEVKCPCCIVSKCEVDLHSSMMNNGSF